MKYNILYVKSKILEHILRVANKCVYVLGRLASKEDVGGAASFCTYLRSIWQLYTQLSVHFPIAMEICNKINNNDVFP